MKKMSFMVWLVHFVSNTWERLVTSIETAGYSEKTLAVYFRKKGAQIGEHCIFHITLLASEPYLVSIGNHVCITSGVMLHTHDGGVWIFREKSPDLHAYGRIIIEDNCIIGCNAQILPNVRIGKNSIVGAGSVVISDVPPNSIVMGVPARVVSSIAKYEERCQAQWQEQRPLDLDMKHTEEAWEKTRRHLMNLFNNQGKKEKNPENQKEDEKTAK
jgi:acetyltransferase-like isoleucine patch superfamily enzyme